MGSAIRKTIWFGRRRAKGTACSPALLEEEETGIGQSRARNKETTKRVVNQLCVGVVGAKSSFSVFRYKEIDWSLFGRLCGLFTVLSSRFFYRGRGFGIGIKTVFSKISTTKNLFRNSNCVKFSLEKIRFEGKLISILRFIKATMNKRIYFDRGGLKEMYSVSKVFIHRGENTFHTYMVIYICIYPERRMEFC